MFGFLKNVGQDFLEDALEEKNRQGSSRDHHRPQQPAHDHGYKDVTDQITDEIGGLRPNNPQQPGGNYGGGQYQGGGEYQGGGGGQYQGGGGGGGSGDMLSGLIGGFLGGDGQNQSQGGQPGPYGPPPGQYGGGYGPPPGQYGGGYGPPPGQYGGGYGPPQGQYGGYGPPQDQYGGGYGPPPGQYGPGGQGGYGPPPNQSQEGGGLASDIIGGILGGGGNRGGGGHSDGSGGGGSMSSMAASLIGELFSGDKGENTKERTGMDSSMVSGIVSNIVRGLRGRPHAPGVQEEAVSDDLVAAVTSSVIKEIVSQDTEGKILPSRDANANNPIVTKIVSQIVQKIMSGPVIILTVHLWLKYQSMSDSNK